ncbi:MAG: NAD(P)H-dependent oxidoreductase subunit E [Planctomycetes bacterium]|nr:NAD(P)H-dependent oxidoreductase subunit E [Planctomycetota bacterium]MBI3848099.1 NAD(P)H-dependent oxidoreductase subunit E [Planctomycetota bacterium]
MDIRVSADEPTSEERAAIDAVLGAPTSSWTGGERDTEGEGHTSLHAGREARSRRDLLLPALHAAQSRVGWITPGALATICKRLTIPPAEAHGVASFYHLFSTTPRPPAVAHVCDDIACRTRGGESICAMLLRTLGPEGSPARDGRMTWKRSPCLGLCERAPAALFTIAGERPRTFTLAPVTKASAIEAALESRETETSARQRIESVRRSVPQSGQPGLRLLRRVGQVDPEGLDAYRASGGFEALRRALSIGPAKVIEEVIASNLVGRGGAAFPTGRKWDAVLKAPARPHYLVCNADESEPGTFKDRLLMEGDPFAVLEGILIAAFAGGCERGFVYVRGEYPLAAERMERAIAAARAGRILGPSVLDSDFAFDVEVRRGAGAYICGEETALFNSIEGKRGEPRNKPPFPVHVGLFGKPTLVNNVETLANVPLVILDGGAAFAKSGTAGSSGPKLFCVSGHVTRPGLYEVPFGKTLRDVVDLAGGVLGGREIGAILLGGAAGVFVGDDRLDVPLTFEGTRAIGATLGSGVVMVFDHTTKLGDVLLRIAAFFRDESCGQCVPCRVGTVRQEELLQRLAAARPLGSLAQEKTLLREIGQAMRDASICGLGQTASSAVESALARFEPFSSGSTKR